MKNLVNFDEDPTPPASKTKPVKKDLIPTKSKIKPVKKDLIRTKSKTQEKIDKIMENTLIDFTKEPYKSHTKKQSFKKIRTEVLNALVNEINYLLTKDILGLNLTNDLEEKISKLTSEAAVGLAWIIRALVLTNKGKLPIYYETDNKGKISYLSKTQIKETIEYYFSSSAILLNLAQKF